MTVQLPRFALVVAGILCSRSAFAVTVNVANTGAGTVGWYSYVDGGVVGAPGSAATAFQVSQSFTTGFDLTSINACIHLSNRAPSTNDTITVALRANGGSGPGAVLASQSFSTTNPGTIPYCFPFVASLSAGSTYHITVSGNLEPNTEGYHVGFDKVDNYAGGLFYQSADGGSTWTANPTWDAIFDITGELAAGTFPMLASPYAYMASPYTEPLLSWTAPTAGAGPNHFRVEWANNPAFTGATVKSSNVSATGFSNTAPCTGPPYAMGCGTIRYKVQPADALANGTTYWWRVSASSDGGVSWRPSDKRSLTVDTSLLSRAWRLTTSAQFDGATLTNVTTAADEAKLVTVGANHALASAGSTVTATTQQASFPPENATDDSTTTFWASTQSPQNVPQELVVDLGQSRVLQRINFHSLNGTGMSNKPEDFTFETSPDNVVWTVRETVVGNTATFRERVLAPTVTARYVKMRCTSATGGGSPTLFVDELRAIGVPPATGSLVTPPIARADLAATTWPNTFYVVTIPDAIATVKVTAQRFSGSWVDTAVVDGPITGPITGVTRTLNTSTLGAETQLRFRIDFTAGSTGVVTSITAGGNVMPLASGPSFAASWSGDVVRVTWETGSEEDVTEFQVLRSDSEALGEAVTTEPIPARGGLVGDAYEWEDAGVERGRTYFYWLEERALDGSTRLTGPAIAESERPSAGCALRANAASSPLLALVALAVFVAFRRMRALG